jgi:hypothetical protein
VRDTHTVRVSQRARARAPFRRRLTGCSTVHSTARDQLRCATSSTRDTHWVFHDLSGFRRRASRTREVNSDAWVPHFRDRRHRLGLLERDREPTPSETGLPSAANTP